MNLFILDPNLAHPHGHHIEWDVAIAAEAREREQHVTIFAHKECPLREVDGVEIVPWFSHSCYDTRFLDPVCGQFDDYKYFNDQLAEELRLLPRERFRPTDAVLVPTLTEKHLLGYISWMKSFDPARAPLFVVYLMFPSGLGLTSATGLTVADPLQALFYKLAFRRADEPGTRIEFFGGGRQLAREFTDLRGAPVEPHPIPNSPVRQGHRPGSRKRPAALLFAGDAKVEKGFGLVPALGDALSAQYPDWDFWIHANTGASWGAALDAYKDLQSVAAARENLYLRDGRLTRAEYLALLEEADCLVSTYDPTVYARKSSGVVWEAISLAMPMLVPADTWLENEAREWGAGYASYEDWSVEGICSAFRGFANGLVMMFPRSALAAEHYHRFNGEEALMNQLGRFWVPRMMAASLGTQPAKVNLQLDRITGQGWSYPETLEGKTVRWTSKAFDIGATWPFDTAWRADIEVSSFIGAEQVTGAQASADGVALSVKAVVDGPKSGRILVSGPGPGADQPQIRLRVELPWAFRPENETRDLGVLVSSVTVGPAEISSEDDVIRTSISVLTKVQRSDDKAQFLLVDAVSGYAVLDPHAGGCIAFDIITKNPAGARSVGLYMNGCPVPLAVVAHGGDRWHAVAQCSPDVLSRGGYRNEWDLVLDRDRADDPVWIADLAARDAGDGISSEAKQHAVAPEEPLVGSRAATIETNVARPAPAEDHAAFEKATLNQHFADADSYAHLDLSIAGMSRGDALWSEVRFKFCIEKGRRRFEFRDLPDWPRVLEFEDAQSDQFGPFLCIGDNAPMPRRSTPRERALLAALVRLLPEAVESALRGAALDPHEVTRWVTEAGTARAAWAHGLFTAALDAAAPA